MPLILLYRSYFIFFAFVYFSDDVLSRYRTGYSRNSKSIFDHLSNSSFRDAKLNKWGDCVFLFLRTSIHAFFNIFNLVIVLCCLCLTLNLLNNLNNIRHAVVSKHSKNGSYGHFYISFRESYVEQWKMFFSTMFFCCL